MSEVGSGLGGSSGDSGSSSSSSSGDSGSSSSSGSSSGSSSSSGLYVILPIFVDADLSLNVIPFTGPMFDVAPALPPGNLRTLFEFTGTPPDITMAYGSDAPFLADLSSVLLSCTLTVSTPQLYESNITFANTSYSLSDAIKATLSWAMFRDEAHTSTFPVATDASLSDCITNAFDLACQTIGHSTIDPSMQQLINQCFILDPSRNPTLDPDSGNYYFPIQSSDIFSIPVQITRQQTIMPFLNSNVPNFPPTADNPIAIYQAPIMILLNFSIAQG